MAMNSSTARPAHLGTVIAGVGLLIGVLGIANAFNVVPKPHFSPIPFVNGVAVLIFCVGIPVAFIGRRYIPQRFS
jgi:hypothetical protein